MKEVEKVSLLTDEKLTQKELEQEDNILIECMVNDQSDLAGRTLMTSNFRRRFNAFILAIRRDGSIIRKKIAHVVIQTYDTLLVYGGRKQLDKLATSGEFILLGEVKENLVTQMTQPVRRRYDVLLERYSSDSGFTNRVGGS